MWRLLNRKKDRELAEKLLNEIAPNEKGCFVCGKDEIGLCKKHKDLGWKAYDSWLKKTDHYRW